MYLYYILLKYLKKNVRKAPSKLKSSQNRFISSVSSYSYSCIIIKISSTRDTFPRPLVLPPSLLSTKYTLFVFLLLDTSTTHGLPSHLSWSHTLASQVQQGKSSSINCPLCCSLNDILGSIITADNNLPHRQTHSLHNFPTLLLSTVAGSVLSFFLFFVCG